MYKGNIVFRDGSYHIEWGTVVPMTPRVRLDTKKDAERLLRFMNDEKFWKQYEPDIIRMSKYYGVYAYIFAEKLPMDEWNLWMFHLDECEGFDHFSHEDFDKEYRLLLNEMYESWLDIQIVD